MALSITNRLKSNIFIIFLKNCFHSIVLSQIPYNLLLLRSQLTFAIQCTKILLHSYNYFVLFNNSNNNLSYILLNHENTQIF